MLRLPDVRETREPCSWRNTDCQVQGERRVRHRDSDIVRKQSVPLKFPNRLRRIIHVDEGLHQAAYGSVMRRDHSQEIAGCAGATCGRCVFDNQTLQIPFQYSPPMSFKANALLQYPVIEADRHTLKIFEKTLRTVRYFKSV